MNCHGREQATVSVQPLAVGEVWTGSLDGWPQKPAPNR